MISSQVFSLIERRAAQELEDRRGVFAREVNEVASNAAMHGALSSTKVKGRIVGIIENELRTRASKIWLVFKLAIESAQIILTEEIASEIKQRLSAILDQHSGDLTNQYKTTEQSMPRAAHPLKAFAQLRSAALERVATEIDFAALKGGARSEPTPGIINIVNNSGVVQTGAGSSASFVKIDAPQRKQVEMTLSVVEKAIQQAASLGEVDRKQVSELIADVTTVRSKLPVNTVDFACGSFQM